VGIPCLETSDVTHVVEPRKVFRADSNLRAVILAPQARRLRLREPCQTGFRDTR
jgi:hypothetical protein